MIRACDSVAGLTAGSLMFLALFTHAAEPAAGMPNLAKVAGRYAIAPDSTIAFSVDQVGGGGIRGSFTSFSGSFHLRASDLARSTVNFQLKPDSAATGQPRIDAFLRSSAVFDSAHFDTISFRSASVEQTGPDSARITGTLTAKGRSSTETFEARLTGWTGRTIAFSVSGRILRSRYSMDVGTPIYSNVVQFSMMIKGQRT